MKYLILLLFLLGCTNKDQIRLNNASLVSPINIEQMDNIEHREKARELNISYVDYLHLINTQKKSVNKSYFKLSHENNE